jgi:N-acetylmuramic acid 6-phosphate etherase
MSCQYVIGVDGGGTKTYGRIQNLQTGEQFEVKGGPSSLTNDFESACETIISILLKLMAAYDCRAEHVSVVIGVAGGGVEHQAEKLQHVIPITFGSLIVCNDAKTSLYGANHAAPVSVVALGTGSVGARLDADCKEYYYGGWGFPIGDQGGGAQLGFSAVQSLLNEYDNDGKPNTPLSQQVLSHIGNTREDVANWLRKATPKMFAELCPIVFNLAESCSAAKLVLYKHTLACESLILTTRKDSLSPVVLLGGLAEPTLKYLSPSIAEFCILSSGTALDGACILAKNNIDKVQSLDAGEPSEEPPSFENQSDFSLLNQLNNMISEGRNPDTMEIDLMDSKQILTQINNEDRKVPLAIEKCIGPISEAVEAVVEAFKVGGRLVYIGAGTSGRLGVLDAVECPPTFSVPSEQVVGIIAGGHKAILKAVEGAEDDPQMGIDDLKNIQFTAKDVLVGIAASGRTPYVLGALDYAKGLGAKTVSLSCNPGSAIADHADIAICPIVGPEVLTGSTRMKSGTAQKLVLNMITTASMIRSGKSYENLMVDVSASNKKLYMRAIRIVMQATQCDAYTAEQALKKTNFMVKLTILHILTGVDPHQGREILRQNEGFLRRSVATLNA